MCNSERHPLTPAKKSPALLFLRSGAGDFLIICFVLLDSCQDQYRSQDNCTQQGEPDLVATEVPDAALRIFLRTDLQALLTLETVAAYIPAAVLRQGQIRRAYLSQAVQPLAHFSLLRRTEKNGRMGSREKTAPIGHRKRQKKRSQNTIPTRISTSRMQPSQYAPTLKFPERSMENTSQGLQPVRSP